ncbi:MAG: PQQ-dependent sugar dehydrogenase [Bacteroidota bacterium]
MKFFNSSLVAFSSFVIQSPKPNKRKGNLLYFLLALSLTGFALPLLLTVEGLDNPVAVGKFINDALPSVKPGGISQWETVRAFPNLSFTDPSFMVATHDGSHFYIGERGGRIYRILNDENTSSKELVLDISANVAQMNDGGLYNMVLHPEFGDPLSPHVGHFYIYYTWKDTATPDPAGFLGTGYPGNFYNTYCRLARFSIPLGSVAALASTELPMIHIRMYNDSHRGSGMAFDNEGYLYLTIGDLYRYNTAQTVDDNLEGGVLRLDVDMDPSRSHAPIKKAPFVGGFLDEITGVGYFIPNDNPFLDPSGNNFEEYYTIGHRNPYRMSYDKFANRLWASEVGQSDREEINVIEKAGNYGWSFREGTISAPRTPPNPLLGSLTEPVIDFDRSDVQSITGGFVYRGNKFPSLLGKYLCGGWLTDKLYALSYDSTNKIASKQYLCQFTPNDLVSYGEDPLNGEIFMLSAGESFGNVRNIYKLAPASVAPSAPNLLSQTGVFKNIATLEVEDYAIPYELNVPFWSDSAAKYRWMIVPNDGSHDSPEERIHYTEKGNWQFPKGAVLVKHFDLILDENNPGNSRRLETRLMVHGDDGSYYGLSYRWDDNQQDATLLTGSREDTFNIQSLTGPKEVVWYYPSRAECITCHNDVSHSVLGPSARQLNKEIFYPLSGRSSNQIKTLAHLGMFQSLPDTNSAVLANLQSSTPTDDLTKNLEDRARSYLDANCAYCHRPGSGNRGFFDARLSTELENQGILYGNVNDDLGIRGARLIIPGNLEQSVLYQRLKAVHESIAMPPLAKNRRDAKGIKLIADWINSLSPGVQESEGFTLGNSYFDEGLLDGWRALMVINESEAYTNTSASAEDIRIDAFNFYAVGGGDPITPFVALRNADNDFTILAIGDTRSNAEYVPGHNEFAFSDASAPVISLAPGATLLTGFMDGEADGTDPGLAPVIPYDAGNPSDEIWITGGLTGAESGSISPGSTPTEGSETQTNLQRNYHYQISCRRISVNQKINQRIDFAEIGPKKTDTPSFAMGASSSSGLNIDYQVISGPASIGGNILTVDGSPGQVIVEARQNGNQIFNAAPPVRRSFYVSDPALGNGTGLLGSYYSDNSLNTLSFNRIDTQVDFYWANCAPDPRINAHTFSVAWEGEIEVPESGNYTFFSHTDDGVKLWVNGVLLIDQWQDQKASEYSGSISLTAGTRVPILMHYYQSGAYASAQLSWSSSNIPQQIIPSQFLYPNTSIFPVEFLEFEAKEEEEAVKLNWTTGFEENIDRYEIERSRDGLDFEEIGEKKAVGNSQEIIPYEAWDYRPESGLNYYRIKSVDIDGQYEYSKVREVYLRQEFKSRVYPNPQISGGEIVLELVNQYPAQVFMQDSKGKLLRLKEVQSSKQLQEIRFSTSSISPGLYFIQIKQKGEILRSHKLLLLE